MTVAPLVPPNEPPTATMMPVSSAMRMRVLSVFIMDASL